jgi:hypothetical protein
VIRRSSLAVLVASLGLLAGSLTISAGARAQSLGPSGASGTPSDELTTLETNLAREHAALSTTDCSTACRALASIRRAADRICALDPDERCVAARAKADDATRRVREACPECAIAFASPEPTPRPPMAGAPKAGAATKAGSAAADADRVSPATASAPPSESRRGGCAGCTTTGRGTTADDVGTFGLVLGALALVMRRRRHDRADD